MTTVATTSWPTLIRPSTPPHCMNTDSWSTSLVTRETSEPRRCPCWCSTERSCTWRKARIAQAGQRGLRRPEQPHVHPVDGDGGDHHDQRAEQDELGDQAHVRVAAGQAAVDDLLDGDRDDDPAGGGDQGEGEGGREAAAELGHHPQAAAQGGERALGPVGQLAHAGTSACE